MNEGKINLWLVTIRHKKNNEKVCELEVVGAGKTQMENSDFYKKRAMRNGGYDILTDKWEISKYNFSAELIKCLDNEVTIK